MDDPKVRIGGREFVVPEFTIKANRKIQPALMALGSIAQALETEENFGKLIDVIYLALTIDGANSITQEEFEALRVKPMQMVMDVLPVIMTQAGLEQPGSKGGAGEAAPQTPLSGETISTTSAPTSSLPPT